jgi:TonB family protein
MRPRRRGKTTTRALRAGLATLLSVHVAAAQSTSNPPNSAGMPHGSSTSPAPNTAGTSSTSPTAPPGAATPALVPPKLAQGVDVAYPEGADGDAVVTLSVVVNRDGTVRSVAVTQGDEPFASAATEAARKFRFEPATRAGEPVAATIRFEIAFKAPVAVPDEEDVKAAAGTRPNASPAKGTAQAAPAEPTEVVVQGVRRAPAVTTFTRAEVRQLPGAFGDPFRAIEAMPGVTPIVSGLPFFYVRGAPPGNVGYFLDGVRVPYLYHVGLGPSVVNPGLVDRVDLYPGGYPARYGRFMGGIVAGETTAPRTDFHGEGNLRIFDVGGVVETGFAGGRGTVMLGGRYSYTATVLSLIAKDVKLDYRDYQARISYDITPHDRVTAFSFGSYDLLGQQQPQGLRVLFGTEFYRLDLRYDHFYGANNQIRLATTLGYDQTHADSQTNLRDKMLGVRAELTHHLAPQAVFRAGADATIDGYSTAPPRYVDPEDPTVVAFNTFFPPRTDMAFGLWSDVVFDVNSRFEVTPGLRADLYRSGSTSKPALDARLATKLKITPKLALIGAFGLAHQPPSFVLPVPGIAPATLYNGLQTSFQTSGGVEYQLPAGITATATLFNNAFFNMTDTLGATQGGDSSDLDQRSLGHAYGLELYIHRNLTERLGGFFTYTLSRSTRSVGNEHFLSAVDRTHVGNVALAYDLGRNWRAGTRFMFYSGVPKIPTGPPGLRLPPRTTDVTREPGFYRLDLRIEKRWPITQRAWISLVAEMLNATFHKETIGDTAIGPVTIPSIGVEGGF